MEKILITPLVGMGDTLMTTPALELLKKHRPDCEITFFTMSQSTHAIMLNNPHIDHLDYYPIKAIHFLQGTFYVFNSFFMRFDTCINFYPSNRSAYNLFSLLTGAKKRIGHAYTKMNFSQLNWLKNNIIKEDTRLHCVEENVRLLSYFGISADKQDIPATKIYLTDEERAAGTDFAKQIKRYPLIGIHAGTSTFKNHAHRRWPKENFVQLINQLPDAHFVLFGALDEIKINQEIKASADNSERVTICTGKTIREVAAIIGELDLFVSNDSGLMHIAAAMDTPTVSILGPTNPNFIYPWHVKHSIVRLGLTCSPCFSYSPKPLRCRLQGKYTCLVQLPVESVVNAVKGLLG